MVAASGCMVAENVQDITIPAKVSNIVLVNSESTPNSPRSITCPCFTTWPSSLYDSGTTMALGYAWFDSYDNAGYVLTLHIFPPYSLP